DLLRPEFRQVGYVKPAVVGLLFAPPADKVSARSAALGNTFAALTELHHYQLRKTRYQTPFDRSEAPVADPAPPFSRVAMLALPKSTAPKLQAAVAGVAARALFNEMLTPAGRVIDEVREVYRKAFPSAVP